jgi:Adaptin C-terminal domain
MENVLNAMPPFAERTNTLLTLNEGTVESTDRSVWATKEKEDEGDAAPSEGRSSGPASSHSSAKPRTLEAEVDLLALTDDDDGNGANNGRNEDYIIEDLADDGFVVSSSGSGSRASASAGASDGFVSITPEMEPQVATWLKKALITIGEPAAPGEVVTQRRALLFENKYIRVTFAGEFRAHQGRTCLFFDNKGDMPMANFAIDVSTVDYAEMKKQDVPDIVSPGETSRMQIAIECKRPFNESPAFQVMFTMGTDTHCYYLKMPVIASSFCDPIKIDRDMYMARWKAMEADKTEVREVFSGE